MKRILPLLCFGLIATVGAVVGVGVLSQAYAANAPLSDEHKQRIVAACTATRSSLSQLHRSDASMRVNRGQLYEYISTKLMARFNGRVALNRLDSTALVAATANYEKALATFRDTYQVYEEQLSGVLRTDCKGQPEAFYEGILSARQKRSDVAHAVAELQAALDSYYRAFMAFRSEHSSEGASNG